MRLPEGTTEKVLQVLDPPEMKYGQDPVGWIENVLSEFAWSKQREVIEDLRDHRYVAVQSAHDTGKSWIASRAAAWWIDAHPPGEAFVVSTAPSQTQVEAILWREIGRAHRKGDLVGRITSGMVPAWKIGAEIVGFGRKPQDLTSKEEAMAAFQGIHARFVLVVIDEAGGVPRWLFDAVDSLATNEASRVLAIGNPDDPVSHFEKICRPGSGWRRHRISAFDTPAFTQEKVPLELLDVLVSKKWVDERKARWGEDSPLYVSKVLGKFPEVTDDTLITPLMLRKATENEIPGMEHGRYGLDIAEYGTDKTILYRNRGGRVRKVKEWERQGTMETAGKVKAILDEQKGYVPVVIDSVGVGSGAADRLIEQGYLVHRFNGGERAKQPKKFVNRRAECYWNLRTLLEDELLDLDSKDEDLLAQLGTIKYTIDSAGRIAIEKKSDMKKRGLPSPDHADALMMACLEPPTVIIPDAGTDQGSLTSDLLDKEM